MVRSFIDTTGKPLVSRYLSTSLTHRFGLLEAALQECVKVFAATSQQHGYHKGRGRVIGVDARTIIHHACATTQECTRLVSQRKDVMKSAAFRMHGLSTPPPRHEQAAMRVDRLLIRPD